jgi:hypothetical protein
MVVLLHHVTFLFFRVDSLFRSNLVGVARLPSEWLYNVSFGSILRVINRRKVNNPLAC